MIEAMRESQLKKPQTPRVRVKRKEAQPAENAVPAPSARHSAPESDAPLLQEGDAAPAKKRRRRRKPTATSGDAQGQTSSGDRSGPDTAGDA